MDQVISEAIKIRLPTWTSRTTWSWASHENLSLTPWRNRENQAKEM